MHATILKVLLFSTETDRSNLVAMKRPDVSYPLEDTTGRGGLAHCHKSLWFELGLGLYKLELGFVLGSGLVRIKVGIRI
jgi:hypothetical protein